MERDASVGGILSELLSLLTDCARDVALYTLVVGGMAAAGVLAGLTDPAAGAFDYGFRIDGGDSPADAAFELVTAVVSIVGTYVLLTRLLAARGRLRTQGFRFWHYLGMAILSTIAAVFGLLLLVVPGVLLLVRWSAASGFAIGAGEGVIESLAASWHATQGHGWAIFFSALILFVGISLCSGVVQAALGPAGSPIVEVVAAFVETASGAILSAFGIAIYCRVHDDARGISEVFA